MSRKRHRPRRKLLTPNSGAHSLAAILPSNQQTPVPNLNVLPCRERCSCHPPSRKRPSTRRARGNEITGPPTHPDGSGGSPLRHQTLASNVKTAGRDQSAGQESVTPLSDCPSWEYLQGLPSWLFSQFFKSFPLQKKRTSVPRQKRKLQQTLAKSIKKAGDGPA